MPDSSSANRDPIEELAEEFLARRRNGERPSLTEYVERHPALADEIRAVFPALLLMERADPASSELARPRTELDNTRPDGVPAQLGDFRILREVGRGGMGVVYEAEQVSLGRRVALKVLPPQAQINARYLGRFEREAKAAARLHHTNIVPVYGVGADRGIHYYAMQFIHGLPLDAVLQELKRLRQAGGQKPPLAAAEATITAEGVARSLLGVAISNGAADAATVEHATAAPRSEASGSANLPGQTEGSSAGARAAYWRSVARVGVQVAEALAYAHAEGVLHRDVKPSNLLLDARGHVWVADFGLAKAHDSGDLTDTGDIVGTLRYMAPEAFDGKADARSDVYALGLTLYELVALAPAFAESDRNKLIKQVSTEEPARLSWIEPRIPRDLATIIHKTIDKDPARRFQTAEELADDLRRFLEDRPIRARRTGMLERSWRWCRRNPAVASLTAVAVLVGLTALLSLGAALSGWALNAALTDSNAALGDANIKLAEAAGEAKQQRLRAEHLLYFNKITLAGREWWDCNIGRADQLLEECPPALRSWEWHYLKRNGHREHRTLPGHPPQAYDVAYSPDGKVLASCGTDHTLRLWDASSGTPRGTLPGDAYGGCVFSPDGRFLAAGDSVSTVRVWDVDGKLVAELKRLGTGFACLAFSPRGDYLAAGNWPFDPQQPNAVLIWDTTRWEKKHALPVGRNRIVAVAFAPDGERIFAVVQPNANTATADKVTLGEFKVWTLADAKLVHEFSWPVRGFAEAAFSRDGRRLATSAGDGTIRLWDRASGKELRTFSGHTGMIIRLAFSADGKRLASCGDDQSIRLWDLIDGRELGVLRGHTAWVNKICFHPEGRWLASASDDGTVKIWDTANTADTTYPEGFSGITNYALRSADGRWLVVQTEGPNGNHQSLWDRRLQKEILTYPISGFGFREIHSATVSGDGNWFAGQVELPLGERKQWAVKVWDLRTGKEKHCLQDPGGRHLSGPPQFDPDGRHLAAPAAPRPQKQLPAAVQLWDLVTGQPAWTYAQAEGQFYSLAFTPDGKNLVTTWMTDQSGTGNSKLVVLDSITGREIRTIAMSPLMMPRIVFSPAGNWLACSTLDNAIELVNPVTGETMRSSIGHKMIVIAMSFSPDGKRLASASYDRTIKIWDTATLEETLTLRGHKSPITSVWFSADGHRLTSSDQSGAIRTWDGTPLP